MLSVRYRAGKTWAYFGCAVGAGLVVVVAINVLWPSAFIGGIGGLIGVTVMLLPGAIKRSARAAPILLIDERGITIDLPDLGTIPWNRIRATRIKGSAWVTGQKLVIEYRGTAPKLRTMDKLNWGVYAKQKGELVELMFAYINLTDQSKSSIEAALGHAAAPAA